MLPVVLFLFQLEAVVELVHLDLIGEVARQDLSDDPAVAEVTLGVRNLIGQVQ